MDSVFDHTLRSHPTADAAFRGVIADLLDGAAAVAPVGEGADKVRDSTRERLGYRFILEDMRARIVASDLYGLDLRAAVARFVWMASGNNRLADIAFYVPKAKDFTDDDIVMPGSSYGHRMRYPSPGIDQIEGVIGRIRKDPASRRGAVSVFHPNDAVRDSRDIPCLFGLIFHPRDGVLHASVMMRSNNAATLLPFNLFELSLLSEVVAVEAGLVPGQLSYTAGSMHLFDRDRDRLLAKLPGAGPCRSQPMGAMPSEPSPLEQIKALALFEAELRHGSGGIDAHNVGEWIDRAKSALHPYWQQLAYMLLASVVERVSERAALDRIKDMLLPEWSGLMTWRTAKPRADVAASAGDLFSMPGAAAEAAANVVPITRTRLATRFNEIAVEREGRTGQRLSAATLLGLQTRFFDRLAARGAEDVVTPEEFEGALEELRRGEA
ncbi:thymidylate synthase [Methylobacterium sp. 1030]|uniref:thymidylate synthase n=1 Tax=Methylobacterium sp. 1030 TaxID=3156404 RepID=UPI003398DD00